MVRVHERAPHRLQRRRYSNVVANDMVERPPVQVWLSPQIYLASQERVLQRSLKVRQLLAACSTQGVAARHTHGFEVLPLAIHMASRCCRSPYTWLHMREVPQRAWKVRQLHAARSTRDVAARHIHGFTEEGASAFFESSSASCCLFNSGCCRKRKGN